ncbi:MAG: putative rhamnosyl transferase [Bacteroidales bacterium]|jgi:hypothetical protein|nr:putative rhamnosyl transferase [Bacteroidales bacterium]
MEHFILTRFNIRLWTKDKKKKPTQTDDWLKKRFELFERFCLPSIQNQKNKDFKWIVLFDADTPKPYLERIANYEKECKQFIPCMVQATIAKDFMCIFQDEVKKNIGSQCAVLVTTYLDNDDAISCDYIDEVQKIANEVLSNTYISFKYGLQYFVQLNIATQVRYDNNHFISFVENCSNRDTIKTVFGYGSHYYIDQYRDAHVLYIDLKDEKKEKWIEIVHDNNVDNEVKATFETQLITDYGKLKREFGIDIELSHHSKIKFSTQFMLLMFKEAIRIIKYKFVKRKWE